MPYERRPRRRRLHPHVEVARKRKAARIVNVRRWVVLGRRRLVGLEALAHQSSYIVGREVCSGQEAAKLTQLLRFRVAGLGLRLLLSIGASAVLADVANWWTQGLVVGELGDCLDQLGLSHGWTPPPGPPTKDPEERSHRLARLTFAFDDR